MPLVILWMIVIFVFSSLPGLQLTNLVAWWKIQHHWVITQIDWTRVFSWDNRFFDWHTQWTVEALLHKMGHIVVFSLLGWLAYRALRSRPKALLLSFLYAGFDELHQAFVPGRSSRLFDVLLDTTVALLGILLAWAFYRRYQK